MKRVNSQAATPKMISICGPSGLFLPGVYESKI
jgi:hypothetical protein